VWDTVGALGIPGSRFCASTFAFHDTSLGAHVRNAFQALAIDEQRGNFQAAVWVPAKSLPQPAGKHRQVLKQMWFPGVHSNIGGGYPEHGLSDTTFLWMISQVRELLSIDDRCVAVSLDCEQSEHYPGGELQNSRTWFWRLVGSPVPRPVCAISHTEQIHIGAWDRAASSVAASDHYKTSKREDWLGTMTRFQAIRTDEETRLAIMKRSVPMAVAGLSRRLDWCSRLMQFIGPRS
jgi:hypothetical protein